MNGGDGGHGGDGGNGITQRNGATETNGEDIWFSPLFLRFSAALCSTVHSVPSVPSVPSVTINSKFIIPNSIVPSAARQIDALISDLSSPDTVAREAAIARLAVIGTRAVARLVRLVRSRAAAPARAAALRALEAVDDPRAVEAALNAVDDPDPNVAITAIAVTRRYVRGPGGAGVVDRLARLAVDRRSAETIRLSALRALGDLDRRTLAPLLSALANDPSAAMRAEAAARRSRRRSQTNPGEVLDQAANLGLPDDPDTLHRAIGAVGNEVALTVLLKIVERVRERETGMKGTERLKWSDVRAAAHAALANRGSRLGVYDLRESLEASAQDVPLEFLNALGLVGDASCLEAIAGAYSRSRDASFLERLADLFGKIVASDGLTRRHAVMKRIQKRWPAAFEVLSRHQRG